MEKIVGKNMKRYLILIITSLILLTIPYQTTTCAAPISLIDNLDDVKHIQMIDGNESVNTDYEKTYLDIYKITYHVLDGTIDLYMVLNGSIKNDDLTSYVLWYNTTETTYKLDYRNGVNYGYAEEKNSFEGAESNQQSNQNISLHASGNVIQVTYQTMKDPSNKSEFWGYALEKSTEDNISEIWVDFIPDSYANSENGSGSNTTDTNGDNPPDNQNKTPSFNFGIFLIALICTICVIMGKKQLKKR